MENFNKLTPAETERLAKLSEECGEVVQIIGKILRHGYESSSPFDSSCTTNRELLMNELADIMRITSLMMAINDLDPAYFEERMAKPMSMAYFHHQEVQE